MQTGAMNIYLILDYDTVFDGAPRLTWSAFCNVNLCGIIVKNPAYIFC